MSGNNKPNNHTPEYWVRLRRQLTTGVRDSLAAYSLTSSERQGANVAKFRREIEFREQLLRSIEDGMDICSLSTTKQKALKTLKKTKEIYEHWDRVANMGCIISAQPAEIAHCHGGSISTILGKEFRPGMAEKQNHWLVLPLSPRLHRGQYGLDANVRTFEDAYGKQVHLLEELSERLGYCVFLKAGIHEYSYQAHNRPSSLQS
jgi:hypothetical protein